MTVRNRLRELREALNFSAARLADAAGVARQTIYAIEDGSFLPNTAVSLRLARALGVSVEEIFALESESAVKPELLDDTVSAGSPVRLCRVGERTIAVKMTAPLSFLPDCDAILSEDGSVPSGAVPQDAVLIAGCDPALSILKRLLGRSGFDVITVAASSQRALEWLKAGKVHAAGTHLLDRATGVCNVPQIRELFPRKAVSLITFAEWEQGIVVARGNPKALRSIADLGTGEISVRNRERGSGSRRVLDAALRSARIPAGKVKGYDAIASTHLEAAYAVATGAADCCIAPRAAAKCFELDFIPLTVERFDICIPKRTLEQPLGKALADTLNSGELKVRLRSIAGHDSTHTGTLL